MKKFIKKILSLLRLKKNSRSFILHLISSRNLIRKNLKIEGCEIGVYEGNYSLQILNHFKNKGFDIKLNLIDPWITNENFSEYGTELLAKAYLKVKSSFKNFDNVNIYREYSEVACKNFKDLSLDFVYIDGNHDYKFVKNDLEIWFPKIKSGGIIFGNDYLRPYGVTQAVNEFAFENKLIANFSDSGNEYFFIKI